MLVETY